MSPGVQPEYDVIKGLIEAAGGTVQAEKPKGKDLLKFIQVIRVQSIIALKYKITGQSCILRCLRSEQPQHLSISYENQLS